MHTTTDSAMTRLNFALVFESNKKFVLPSQVISSNFFINRQTVAAPDQYFVLQYFRCSLLS